MCDPRDIWPRIMPHAAHMRPSEHPRMLQVAHDQAVARQRQKLTADFGVVMHIAWARHLLGNREFVGGGTQPNTSPGRRRGV